MGLLSIKLPDVGEGVVEAEIVEWHVKVGSRVAEDDNLVDIMTDKATVEIPSPVTGVVKSITGEPGDVLAVGTVIVTIETDGAGAVEEESAVQAKPVPEPKPEPAPQKPHPEPTPTPHPEVRLQGASKGGATSNTKPLASPAVRKAALEADIELANVPGTGPAGRITHQDLEDFIAAGGRLTARAASHTGRAKRTGTSTQKIIGLRRKIAQNLAHSKRTIPHFAYVEEVDMEALETLRAHLNANRTEDQPKLTLLPFLSMALIKVLPDFPNANAHYDNEAGVATKFEAVHMGIATATPNGLMVPVVKHAEAMDIWTLASEIARVTTAARDGKAHKDELSGSTITITSLGALGGIASTPVINAPEVAIIGVNKLQIRPVWQDGAFAPRKMMNLSSSFDHRIVDGYDAALMIQRVKTALENPATLFM
ncbi:MAG: dihydrolipoamide acetyltransferase family protein [Robiginitomaculum sp.]|nr:dihydrolipoamide acetyltransferase family protein [Robiginitomaculum sp.]MDQ7076237.1 dihydrolipoamide acetyltransferase family protein [Robiginitomaculum sp.]